MGAEVAHAGVLLLVAALLAAAFASLSNGLGVLMRQRESLIGAVSLLLLPLTFLSSALMQLSLAPGWIETVARVQPGRLGRGRRARPGTAADRAARGSHRALSLVRDPRVRGLPAVVVTS